MTRCLIILLACAIGFAAPAFGLAQERTFEDIARSNWQYTKIEELNADQPIREAEKKQPEERREPRSQSGDRWIALILFAGLLIAGLWYLAKNPQTSGLFAGRAKKPSDEPSTEANTSGTVTIEESSGFSLDALSRMEDLRHATHLLLVNALARVAHDNKIHLRRSMTAREVLEKLPHRWSGEEAIRSVVGFAEPVVFGERPVDPERFEVVVEKARSLFRKRSGVPR